MAIRKSSIGILEVDRATSLPNLKASRGGFGFEGTTPKYWNGTTWSAFSGAEASVATWDSLYDLDKSLTIDDSSLTFALTHATNDGVTFTTGVGTTGDAIQITTSGSGSDIKGTSNTWAVSKAGAITCTSIADSVTNGDLAIDGNGSGKVTINGTGTGNIELQRNVTMPASKTLTMAGVDGSTIVTLTAGDVVVSDGSLAVTDSDNAVSFALVNATVTTADVATITAAAGTTGNTLRVTSDAITEGSILYLDNGGASLTTGFFINCNDDGVSDFTVGADGATKITGAVNSSIGLTVTGIQTNENMVVFTSSGVTASDKASLLLNPSGAIASGGNILRIAPSGAPNAGAIAVELVGASKVCQMMYIDGDSTAASVVEINGGGALTDGLGVLKLSNDGNLASGGNVLNVTIGGTPNAAAIGVEIAGAGKALTALSVDSDPTASSTAVINGGGALTNGYAVLTVSSDGNLASGGNTFKVATAGTPASGAMYAEFDFTGITDTNENVGVKIDAGGKKVVGLHVDGDPIANSLAYFHTDAAIAADKAVVEINGEASADNADSAILRVEQGATDGVANVIALKQDDVSEPFISFETTIGTGNAIQAVAALNLTATHYIMVDIEGVGKRYLAVGTLS